MTERETAAGAGLRTTNPPSGARGFHDNVARGVSRKLVAEGFHVARHRGAELVDESPAVATDEVGLASGHLVLPDAHRVPLPLVIGNPLDPVRDRHTRTHINALRPP